MNVKKLVVVGAAVGLVGLSGGSLVRPAFANDTGQKQSKSMEKQTKASQKNLRQLSLKVKDVDKANHKVTFEAQISPEANIQENGVPIKIDQLKAGDEVRASFVPQTGEVVKLNVTRSGEQQKGEQQNMEQNPGQQGSQQEQEQKK
jgi:hypothetical protein